MTEDFGYDDFGSTEGLTLNSGAFVSGDEVVLAEAFVGYETRAVFRTTQDYFDDNWSMFFRVSIEDNPSSIYGLAADGYAIVWARSSDYLNAPGGAVGYFNADLSTGGDADDTRAVAFRHFIYQDIIYSVDGAFTSDNDGYSQIGDFRVWLDYDSDAQTMTLYRATSDTKPDTPSITFTGVSFGTGGWYLGITSATGAGSMNCRLKAWSLEGGEAASFGWGITL